LAEKENWGDRLADRKHDKARATVVGSFFRNFRLKSRQHVQGGSEYQVSEAAAALERHLPETTTSVEEGFSVSVSAVTATDSANCPSETDRAGMTGPATDANPACGLHNSSAEVSAGPTIENTPVAVEADTLTLKGPGTAPIVEEL
jgi:hypothetical protein